MALAQENILGSFLPTVYISKITLNETKVDLELMIIDTANNDLNGGVFSLINNEFLADCVEITVMQSATSQEEIFSQIAIQESGQENSQNLNETQSVFTNNEAALQNENATLFRRTNNQTETIPINQQNNFEIDEEGNRKFYYSVSFDLETTNLQHLVYSTSAEIKTLALTTDKYGLSSLTEQELRKVPKKITTEIVIDDFKLVSDSYVYYLGNSTDNLWIGEVININGEYQTLESPPRTLLQVRIPNNKIQDFRIRKLTQQNKATQEFIDSAESITAITNINKFEVERANINSVLSKPRIFEEPIKYINSDGSVSLSILINMEQLIRQNCLYPSLLESDFADQIIQNMVLYRRQIKETSSNDGKLVTQEIENIVPVVIPQNFRDNKKTNIGIYSHFLLQDQEIKNVTNGKYQYGVNIRFQDPTIGVLQNILFEIIGLKKRVLEYYHFCEANIERKTFSFKLQIQDQYPTSRVETYTNIYIENYVKIYSSTSSDLNQRLNANISPVTGSLDGIFLFIKMLDDLVSDLSKLLSISNSTTNVSNFNRTDINNASAKSSVEISKYFSNLIYDADKFTKLELKYFDINDGVVNDQQFYDRINNLIEPFGNEILYVNPKSISIYKNNFDFGMIDQASKTSSVWLYPFTASSNNDTQEIARAYELIQNNKYGFIKNKIVDILANREFGADLKLIKDTLTQTSNVLVIASDLPVQVNNIIQNNIFNDYSVNLFYDEKQITPYTIGDRQVVKIDKIRDEAFIEKIIYPSTTIDTQNSTNRILNKKNNLDLNNEEEKFKYLMLNKIQYLVNNNNALQWSDLTIDELINQLANNLGPIVCRMLRYDYSELGIENIDNLLYNDYFILNYTFVPATNQTEFSTVNSERIAINSESITIEQNSSFNAGQDAGSNQSEILNVQQNTQNRQNTFILENVSIVGFQLLEDNFQYYTNNSVLNSLNYPIKEAKSAIYEIMEPSTNNVIVSSNRLTNKTENFSYSFNLSNRKDLNNGLLKISVKIYNIVNEIIATGHKNAIIIIPSEQGKDFKDKAETQFGSSFVASALRRNR